MLHLIFSVPCLFVLTRFVAPLPWPLLFKLALGAAMLVASQYHLWSRLSSGSVFAPEFPRPIVLLFNWAFSAILLLAVLQLAIDLGSLVLAALRQGGTAIPASLRYVAAELAAIPAAIGVPHGRHASRPCGTSPSRSPACPPPSTAIVSCSSPTSTSAGCSRRTGRATWCATPTRWAPT